MSTIQSVTKALKLLQALDAHGGWLGVRELARKLDLAAPTTHNILNTLRVTSFVEYNAETRQYRLGMAAIRLGEGADPLNQMRLFARPYIEALANEFDETVIATTWLNDQMVVVDWIQAEHPLAVTHTHGVIDHPIIFASGRVLLAYQPKAVQLRYAAREDLSKFGPNSPLTADDMLTMLAGIVTDGFAITTNVANSGIAAVSAPVFDANHQPMLAIGCSEPISRSTDLHLTAVKQRLCELTAEMTKKLGGGALSTPSKTSVA